jgi:5-methylthioribose kinase
MTTVLRNLDKDKIKVVYFSKPEIIRKVSSNKKYFKYLKNEKQGLSWYNSNIKKENSITSCVNNKDFSYIDIKFYKGRKKKFYNSILDNEDILLRAIDHYVSAWPKKKITKCHGDLTLDNIIYNDNEIRFIDWELFGLSQEVWGYDIVYLVISSIFFPFDVNKKISKNEKKTFFKIWSKLHNLNIYDELLLNPISYFSKIYKKKHWKIAISEHPNKIYPKSINKEFAAILKNIIS